MMLTVSSKAAKYLLLLGVTACSPLGSRADSQASSSEEEATSAGASRDNTMVNAVTFGSTVAAAGSLMYTFKDFSNDNADKVLPGITAAGFAAGLLATGAELLVHDNPQAAFVMSAGVTLPWALAGAATTYLTSGATADRLLEEQLRQEEEAARAAEAQKKADLVGHLGRLDAENPDAFVTDLLNRAGEGSFALHPEAEAVLVTKLKALNTAVLAQAEKVSKEPADKDQAEKAAADATKLARIGELTYEAIKRAAPTGTDASAVCAELLVAWTDARQLLEKANAKVAAFALQNLPKVDDKTDFATLCKNILDMSKLFKLATPGTRNPIFAVSKESKTQIQNKVDAFVKLSIPQARVPETLAAAKGYLTELEKIKDVTGHDLFNDGDKTSAVGLIIAQLKERLFEVDTPSAQDLLAEVAGLRLAEDGSNVPAVLAAIVRLGKAEEGKDTLARRKELYEQVEKAIHDSSAVKADANAEVNKVNAEKILKLVSLFQETNLKALPTRGEFGYEDDKADRLITKKQLGKLQRHANALVAGTGKPVDDTRILAALDNLAALRAKGKKSLSDLQEAYLEFANIAVTHESDELKRGRTELINDIRKVYETRVVKDFKEGEELKKKWADFLAKVPRNVISTEYQNLLKLRDSIRVKMCNAVKGIMSSVDDIDGIMANHQALRDFLKEGFGGEDADAHKAVGGAFDAIDRRLHAIIEKKSPTLGINVLGGRDDYQKWLADVYVKITASDKEPHAPAQTFTYSTQGIKTYVDNQKPDDLLPELKKLVRPDLKAQAEPPKSEDSGKKEKPKKEEPKKEESEAPKKDDSKKDPKTK